MSLLIKAEEQALLAEIRALPFRDFEFHGFIGKRRVVSFGWRYDFNGGGLEQNGGYAGAFFCLCVNRLPRSRRFPSGFAAGSGH